MCDDESIGSGWDDPAVSISPGPESMFLTDPPEDIPAPGPFLGFGR